MADIEQKEADLSNDKTPDLSKADDTSNEAEEVSQEPKREYSTEEKLARVSRLKQRYEKELGIEPTVIRVESAPEKKGKPGELDDTALDYLDLKGFSEDEDLNIIKRVMNRSGMSVRETLKDEYVIEKLKTNKQAREVKAAIPSSTKRSGNQVANIDALIAKYERTGELPADFDTRSTIIDAMENKTSANVPPWRR